MKKYGVFGLLMGMISFTAAHAADLDDRDIETLKEWINSKRLVSIRQLGGDFSISGDVHTEIQTARELLDGVSQRGFGKNPTTTYDLEFNLSFDYRLDNAWVATRLRFDNDLGLVNETFGSGKNSKFKIDRAYMGFRLIDSGTRTLDVELGRRGMSTLFNSKVQFGSNFDGVNLKDSYKSEKVGDLYYQLGLFSINENQSRFGLIGELGVDNIAGTRLYAKYGMTDWNTKKSVQIPRQFDFAISQMTLGYNFDAFEGTKPASVYAAALYNHRARANDLSAHKKANLGGYFGVNFGKLKKASDWALDVNYQILEAQCVPDFDVQGIGLGNASEDGFYYYMDNKVAKPNTGNKPPAGNVNFHGYEVTLQYLISPNFNIFQQWKQSRSLSNDIGSKRRFHQYEIDFIYLF